MWSTVSIFDYENILRICVVTLSSINTIRTLLFMGLYLLNNNAKNASNSNSTLILKINFLVCNKNTIMMLFLGHDMLVVEVYLDGISKGS